MSSRAIKILLAFLLPTLLVVSPIARAATPLVAVKPMSLIALLDSSESAQGMLVKKSAIYIFGTTAIDIATGATTTDGFVKAFDATGNLSWSLVLDTGEDDIATSAGLDPFGNIWIAGSSASAPDPVDPISPDLSGALNPDSVTAVPKIPLRGDLNLVTTWLVSPSGVLISTFSKDVGRSILVKAVSASAATISIAGVTTTALGTAGFLIQTTRRGSFGKFAIIGKRDTEINSILKNGKKILLLGSSSETLFGKARSGVRDATTFTYSSSGIFISLLRSFNSGASRSWQSGRSATDGFVFSGDAVSGTKTEAVVTKYSSALSPIWSAKFTSAGPALVADSAQVQFATFSSIGSIAGLKSWKPAKAQLISLVLDKSGQITEAFSAKGAVSPISTAFSAELGAVMLARGPEGVSIFHVLTR